ncbi:MAG: pseudouridine synthase [Bacteroidota bacterium]
MANVERKDPGVHQEDVRLNKFLAMAGVGSRRSNDELILSGAVKINGRVIQELGVRVNPLTDIITVHGKRVHQAEKNVYVLLNKPKDAITTVRDEKGRTTVMDYVKLRERVFPVGRLDRNTTGVLILTNDGELANAMMHPKFEIEKFYRVALDKPCSDLDLRKLKQGVRLEDGPAKAQEAEIIRGTKRTKVLLAIQEGRNREVRRMFEALGYKPKQLDRVSFAGITPLGLPRGKWRFLTNDEVRHLKEQVGLKTTGRRESLREP